MVKVVANIPVGPGVFLLKCQEPTVAKPGQFYMVRTNLGFPLLSRPLSVLSSDGQETHFLYHVLGEGTKILSSLNEGMDVLLEGPYGEGFPMPKGEKKTIGLIGGGMGAAPLLLLAKRIREERPEDQVEIYLGFQRDNDLGCLFQEEGFQVTVQVGGLITERIPYERFDMLYSCGPEAMMRRIYAHTKNLSYPVYVSLEKYMACGVGACLGCTQKTKSGQKRVCKEGPVFLAKEVFYE